MKALLDTHVWLWMLTAPERLGPQRPVVEDAGNRLLLSAASTWEIAWKYATGRLELPEPPGSYVPARMRSTGVEPLPISSAHTLAAGALPLLHRDPFDRLLVAQAQQLRIPLLTADPVTSHRLPFRGGFLTRRSTSPSGKPSWRSLARAMHAHCRTRMGSALATEAGTCLLDS